jgi:hypothetical protein
MEQPETPDRSSDLVRHSRMLGQIASEVEQWCINDQATTLDAVKYLKADWMRLKGIVEMNAIEKRLSA